MSKRATINLIIVLLFSLMTGQLLCQQLVEQHNYDELTTAIFNTSEGQIKIYIPNFVANEHISGRIVVEPSGDSEKKRTKSNAKLQNYQLAFGENIIPLSSKSYSLTVSKSSTKLSLLDEKKNSIASVNIPLNSNKTPTNPTTSFPAYVVTEYPAKITVSNDGDINNSSVFINNTNTQILAASETHVFFRVPSNLKGKTQLQYRNDTTNMDGEVNVLQLQISADKLNLLKSETTTLKVSVSGLEGLDTNVPLTLTNDSPSNITLEGGNHQEISIQPNGDSFQLNQTITATQGGGFSISAIILPSENTNEQPANDPLCNCFIDGYSYLISPEACEELDGQTLTNDNGATFARKSSENDHLGNFNFYVKTLLSYTDDIDDLKNDINDEWGKYDHAKHVRDSLNGLHNDLVAIDKVLDKVPDAYKDQLKKAVDSLVSANDMASETVSDDALNKAIADAQARVDACKKRISELEVLVKQQENELETLEEEINKLLKDLNKVLDDYCLDSSCLATLKTNKDGSISLDYNIPKEADQNTRDYIAEFTDAILKATSKHRRALKAHKQSLENLEAAKDDCSQLDDALNKAQEAKAKADYKAAKELELEEQCEQLKRILHYLKTWCKNNPDHCDFIDDINDLLATCPKTEAELEDFWKTYDALVAKKKALEDQIEKKVKDAQDDMDDAENAVSALQDEINKKVDQERQKYLDELERKYKIAQAKAKEEAEAKAAADASKKQRDTQKKEDDKIKDLIKKAKNSDAGDDAFNDLLNGTGLSLLDEVSGESKLGTIIGGLLAAKDIPDCTCPIITALRDAIAARDKPEGPSLAVEEYLRLWKDCANLPSFPTSVAIGGSELTKAIKGMTDAQAKKALNALNQAVRIQCK